MLFVAVFVAEEVVDTRIDAEADVAGEEVVQAEARAKAVVAMHGGMGAVHEVAEDVELELVIAEARLRNGNDNFFVNGMGTGEDAARDSETGNEGEYDFFHDFFLGLWV